MQEKKDNQNFEENKDSTIKVNVIEEGQSSKSQGSKRSQQLKSQSKNNKKKEEGQMLLLQKERSLQVRMQNPSKQEGEARLLQQYKQKSSYYNF